MILELRECEVRKIHLKNYLKPVLPQSVEHTFFITLLFLFDIAKDFSQLFIVAPFLDYYAEQKKINFLLFSALSALNSQLLCDTFSLPRLCRRCVFHSDDISLACFHFVALSHCRGPVSPSLPPSPSSRTPSSSSRLPRLSSASQLHSKVYKVSRGILSRHLLYFLFTIL